MPLPKSVLSLGEQEILLKKARSEADDRRRQPIAMDHVAPLVIAGLAVALVGWAVVVLTSRNRSR